MEIAVVGAGPAGAFCAEKLAMAGHGVTVFDPSHPREKACGGGVTPIVFERYPELLPLCEAGRPAKAARIRTPGGRELRLAIPEPIHIFSREVLDGLMLERAVQAGAKHVAERVRNVEVIGEGVRLESTGGEARFDFVVGAGEHRSLVLRDSQHEYVFEEI